jgi:hypothetical protein
MSFFIAILLPLEPGDARFARTMIPDLFGFGAVGLRRSGFRHPVMAREVRPADSQARHPDVDVLTCRLVDLSSGPREGTPRRIHVGGVGS